MQYCSGGKKALSVKLVDRTPWTANKLNYDYLLSIVLPFFSLISKNVPQDEKSHLKICDVIKSWLSRNSQRGWWEKLQCIYIREAAHSSQEGARVLGEQFSLDWMDAIFAFNIQLYCISHLRFTPHPFPPSPSSSRASKFSSPTSCFPPFFLSCPLLSSQSLPSIVPSHPLLSPELSFNNFLLLISFHPSLSLLAHPLSSYSLFSPATFLYNFSRLLCLTPSSVPLFVSILPLSSSVEFSPFSHFGFHSFFSPLSQIHFLDFSFT